MSTTSTLTPAQMTMAIFSHLSNRPVSLESQQACVRLIESGADLIEEDNITSPLHIAANLNVPLVLDALIARMKNIDTTNTAGSTALVIAASVGHIDNVRKLLAAGAHIDADHSAALSSAVTANQHDVIMLLLESGINTRPEKWSKGEAPIITATRAGRIEQVRALLRHGAYVDAVDSRGLTPLIIAPDVKMTDVLIQGGAAIEARTHAGLTALAMAAANGLNKKILRLLDADADIDAPDNNGLTPIMQAINEGHEATVKLLIEQNADVTAETKKGVSVLTLARRHSSNMEVLIENAIVAQREARITRDKMLKTGMPIDAAVDVKPARIRIAPKRKHGI